MRSGQSKGQMFDAPTGISYGERTDHAAGVIIGNGNGKIGLEQRELRDWAEIAPVGGEVDGGLSIEQSAAKFMIVSDACRIRFPIGIRRLDFGRGAEQDFLYVAIA